MFEISDFYFHADRFHIFTLLKKVSTVSLCGFHAYIIVFFPSLTVVRGLKKKPFAFFIFMWKQFKKRFNLLVLFTFSD